MPATKKRGRPRTTPSRPAKSAGGPSSPQGVKKRGRGRPPKQPNSAAISSKPAKRGRGRPKKTPSAVFEGPDPDSLEAGTFVAFRPNEIEVHDFWLAEFVGSIGTGPKQRMIVRWLTPLDATGKRLSKDTRVFRFWGEEREVNDVGPGSLLCTVVVEPVVEDGSFSDLRVAVSQEDLDELTRLANL